MARYETLLEVEIDEWKDGYGVLQVVSEEAADENELRFCYYNAEGQFTNRPLTLSPEAAVVERTGEVLENLGYVARTLDPEEIRELVETLGEQQVIELAQLVDTLGETRLAEMLSE